MCPIPIQCGSVSFILNILLTVLIWGITQVDGGRDGGGHVGHIMII